jgi:hypothetical protein
MSAFIVSDETFNNIVYGLLNLPKGVFIDGFSDYEGKPELLGKHLLKMNRLAIYSRYKVKGESRYRYKTPVDVSPVQLYKLIQCLLYQCSEGKVPKMKLFKRLDVMRDVISDYIISSMEEYKLTNWG